MKILHYTCYIIIRSIAAMVALGGFCHGAAPTKTKTSASRLCVVASCSLCSSSWSNSLPSPQVECSAAVAALDAPAAA